MAKVAEPEEIAARRNLLGALMQGVRVKMGKSKQDCAQVMGVTAGVYTSFEEGRRDMTLPELELLAYYLKVPVRLFFERPERLLADEPTIPAEKVVASAAAYHRGAHAPSAARSRQVGQGCRAAPGCDHAPHL